VMGITLTEASQRRIDVFCSNPTGTPLPPSPCSLPVDNHPFSIPSVKNNH
jgi:hypothetical protein